MARIAALLILLGLIWPAPVFADSRVFLGTRTGWARTAETFTYGKYKETRMFLVIGTEPTAKAIKDAYHWDTGSTFMEDIRSGVKFFDEQIDKSVSSVPKNADGLATSASGLIVDPIEEIQDFSLLTPAVIVGKTVVNSVKIVWYAVMLPCEPVGRAGVGTLALAGSPFIKPVQYAGKYTLISGIAAYGYASSAVGGAVLLGATGAVLALDIATSPFVAAYEVFSD